MAEIEKVLKKVSEGVEVFESIFEKIQTAGAAAQKEKLEGDLKKEIKKLQRYRDQIKTWIASNEIKDKKALLDNRRLIESQMEKFKACEKELKTKAFSKEGLQAATKIDPLEREKGELCHWVSETVDKLSTQVDLFEAEAEVLQGAVKKARKPDSSKVERLAKIEHSVERHKHHMSKLEIVLRMLENGDLPVESVKNIRDDVNFYADSNEDPEFEEDEGIYDDLNLVEPEAYGLNADDDSSSDSDEDSSSLTTTKEREKHPAKEKEKEVEEKKKVVKEKELVAEPEIAATSPSKVAKTSTTTRPHGDEHLFLKSFPNMPRSLYTATAVPVPTATASTPLATAKTANKLPATPRSGTIPVTTMQPPPRMNSESSATPPSQRYSAAASGVTDGRPASATGIHGSSGMVLNSFAGTASVTAEPGSISTLPATAGSSSTTTSSPVSQSATVSPAAPPSTWASSETATKAPTATKSTTDAAVKEEATTPASEGLPQSLADLVSSFENYKDRSQNGKEDPIFFQRMLETSFQFAPESFDSEKPKQYMPKTPYPTPSYYPSTPLAAFDNPAIFEKLDIDTLFFIFYYQQGTCQQFLAAKELKRQSWRFHKKYLTWFQRHEEPKAITDEYEQGTYIYFDYEGTWCQRKKNDFRFDYKWLEDDTSV
ncbi:general negative regulator of transcription subunit 5 [Blyttiomyces sp. JEL0837]|nr:general negative regulator of transcription subunit 5 [Blyttiomyces sp. JEL0837]